MHQSNPPPAAVPATSSPGAMRLASVERRWLLLLLAAAALLYVLTLRPGHPWHDDFALYVLHARNLVEGRSYADTGFIYNPANPRHSPEVYPPGFPLLLAPVYALFGLDLFALRLVVIGSAVAAFAAFAAVIRPALAPRLVLATTALVAFQPFFARFKNLLLPDFTFVLFVMLSLHLVGRLHETRTWSARDLAWAVLAGCCIYAAISLRTVGVTLFGALILYHILRRRIPTLPVLVCVATALLLYGVQSALMPSAAGYAAQLTDAAASAGTPVRSVPLQRIRGVFFEATDVVRMFVGTDVLWSASGELNADQDAGVVRAVVVFFMFVTGALGLMGFVLRLKRLTIVETFVVSYVGAILIWGAASARYLLPMFPFLFFYAVVALSFLNARGGRVVRGAIAALAVAVGVIYAANLARMETRPYAGGVTGRDALEVYDYIERCTRPEDRLATHRPRALALFTRRSATIVPQQGIDTAGLVALMGAARLDHVVAVPDSRLAALAAADPAAFTPTFRNERFVVYRYATAAAAPSGCRSAM